MRNMLTIVCALAILASAGPAWGTPPANFYFIGGDSLWMTPNNWFGDDGMTAGPPNDPSDDNAWIGFGLTCELRSDTVVATPKRLKMCGAGTLEIYTGAELDLTQGGAQYAYVGCNGPGYGDGTVKMLGGTFTTCGIGLGKYGATGTLVMESGTVDATGFCGINLANGREQGNGTGIITQTGGTINFVHTTYLAYSGNIAMSTSDWVGDMHDTTSVYTISGGTLYARRHVDATTDGAELLLGPTNDNCTGNSATFHVIGAWDTGVDNIRADGLEMSALGTNKATLVYDIDGTAGIEKIVLERNAIFDGKLVVTTTGSDPTTPYTLMTYASATGDFDELDLPTGWTHNVGATALTVIPEPMTLTLLGLGGLGVLLRRRRK